MDRTPALRMSVKRTSMHPPELLSVRQAWSKMGHSLWQGQLRAAPTLDLVTTPTAAIGWTTAAGGGGSVGDGVHGGGCDNGGGGDSHNRRGGNGGGRGGTPGGGSGSRTRPTLGRGSRGGGRSSGGGRGGRRDGARGRSTGSSSSFSSSSASSSDRGEVTVVTGKGVARRGEWSLWSGGLYSPAASLDDAL